MLLMEFHLSNYLYMLRLCVMVWVFILICLVRMNVGLRFMLHFCFCLLTSWRHAGIKCSYFNVSSTVLDDMF